MNQKAVAGLLASFLLIGCAAEQTETEIEKKIANDVRGSINISSGRTNHYQNEETRETPEDVDQKNMLSEERAKKIAKAVSEMEAIEKASAAITGNTAIVGINLKQEMPDGKVVELKREIEKYVKSIDAEIDHVAVTASPELYERIKNLTGGDEDDPELEKNKQNDVLFRIAPTV